MRCIYCNHEGSRVVDSRPSEEGNAIRRRRECEKCGRRFTTFEKIDAIPMMVIKKDFRREPFDLEKLRAGILKACEKRPISIAQIDELARGIERRMFVATDQEVRSSEIGEMVMEGLKELDQVAYIRFAAVYREFRDIRTFMEELGKLLGDTGGRES